MHQIGYTNDGKVWLIIYSTYENKPVSTKLEFDPRGAIETGKNLAEAAEQAELILKRLMQ